MPSATLPGALPLTLDADPPAVVSVSGGKPPLDLSVVLTAPNGSTTRLGSEDRSARNIPQNMRFGSQRMSGFTTGSFGLRSEIDRDRPDLGLLHGAQFVGADGSVAFDGHIGNIARSAGDGTHQLDIPLAGWASHMTDQPFTAIFVDRDLGQWGSMSRGRKVALLTAAYKTFEPTSSPDSTGSPSVSLALTDSWQKAAADAWYDAGPLNLAASVNYEGTKNGTAFGGLPGGWNARVASSDDDAGTTVADTGNLLATGGPWTGTFTPATPRRYFFLGLSHNAVFGAAGNHYQIDWTKLAVRGDHGLPNAGTAAPYGVTASDVIRYLAGRYCQMLDVSGVQDTTFAIPHLVFRDDITVYDALVEINRFHLWDMGVWENKLLKYGPVDLTDWDWEIRHDEPWNTVGLQGDSVEDLYSGIILQYQNVATGATEKLHPDNYAELRDDGIENVYVRAGRPRYKSHSLTHPTTTDAALQMGAALLAELNQPKAPGSFTASHYVKDRAGHWQPAWKVRAGDRVRLTSSASISDRPRIVHETDYDQSSRRVTIATDATLRRLDAFFDRQDVALVAAGLR